MLLFDNLAKNFPMLEPSLKSARMSYTPGNYLKRCLISALALSVGIGLILGTLSVAFELGLWFATIFFFVFFVFFFYYFFNIPQFYVLKAEKVIESEIVSAIRFLVMEIKSERSLYSAMENTSKNFSLTGIYFDEIINGVKLGKTLERAINEAVEVCPSPHLRQVYWQLLNSIQTGADITDSLENLLEDIVEKQKIRVEEYGRELNALALFYMMISIIIPTIGLTIVTAVLTFIGVVISLPLLISIWLAISIVQYLFLIMSSYRRPAVEAY